MYHDKYDKSTVWQTYDLRKSNLGFLECIACDKNYYLLINNFFFHPLQMFIFK